MSAALFKDAFGHHNWATLRLIEACQSLEPAQLEATSAGTYGSIIQTLRHLVGSESFYLSVTDGGRTDWVDADGLGLADLRAEMQALGRGWAELLEQDLDPDRIMREVDPSDGFTRDATIGILLAEQLAHGAEHRTHVCSILGSLGLAIPKTSVWDYGEQNGRVREISPGGGPSV